MHIVTPNMRKGYIDLCDALFRLGEEVSPRGEPTIELSDVQITLTDPAKAIPYDVGRNLHMAIASAEFIQLLGGYSDVEQLKSISPVFDRFTDGGRLRGAYGPRLHKQWPKLLKRLTADPNTRQGVVTIWRENELENDVRDVPCTISLSYTIRNGALDARTHMRSNDFWLGTPYDFGQFTALQRTLAFVLGVEVGTYTHFVNSLHMYKRDINAAKHLVVDSSSTRDLMPPITFDTTEKMTVVTRWDLVQSLARRIAIGDALAGLGNIHFDRLRGHISKLPICHICRYAYDPDPERFHLNVCDECIK
jgi:thymidylate synthase